MSDTKTSEISIHNKMEIPLFEAGKRGPMIFSAGTMNVLVRILRAIVNPKITRGGNKDAVTITDGNYHIELADSGGSGSSKQTLRLATPTEERKIVVASDHLVCRTWDGTTEGSSDIYVAKQWEHRCSITAQTILGVDYEFTYATDADEETLVGVGYGQNVIRTQIEIDPDTDEPTGDEEDQRIVPPWKPGTLIFADYVSNSLVTVGDNPVTLIESNASRQWAKIS